MNLQPFALYLGVAEIVLAVALTVLVLLQTKGASLGGLMGGGGDSSGGFRTRRGVEATMHRVTIACALGFFICTVLTFLALGQAA